LAAAGVREIEKSGQRGDGVLIGGLGPHSAGAWLKLGFKPIQKYSNEIRIPPNFGWFKRYFPKLQKFEIK
jgi:hypothetical protein